MRILTRFILLRFLGNFFLLFSLIFIFAISIDILIQWETFVSSAARIESAKSGVEKSASILSVAQLIFSFHGPRVFQFYQYMMPLVALAAMGFTASAMLRTREFVAMMAVGISMRRAVFPIIMGMGLLCFLQIANQEFILPRLAERLLLEHGDMVRGAVRTWGIGLASDSQGRLIHAASFDPATETLTGLYAVERTKEGAVVRRIEAPQAKWSAEKRSWILVNGRVGVPTGKVDILTGDRPSVFSDQQIDFFQTDLDPDTLRLRQNLLYAHMLSLSEIADLARNSAFDPTALRRFATGRFASLLVGLLVLAISIPFFALREPAPILKQAVSCAALSLPILLTSMIMIALPLPSFPPTVGVILPVVILLPIAVWRIAMVKT